MNNINECIICMNEINNDNFIKMECCNAIFHDSCIKEWIISNNNTNTDINKCIYCKQNTKFYDDIISYTISAEINNYILIDISNVEHYNSYNSYNIYMRVKHKLIIYILIASFIVIIAIIIIPAIIKSNI